MTLKEQALRLYKKVFYEDSEDFARSFTYKYFDKCCRFLEKDGKIVSMLYLLDCKVFDGEKDYSAYYLYAAATDPDYRNQGFMGNLVAEALKENKVIITRPANEQLFGFYRKLGFTVCSFKDEIKKELHTEDILSASEYTALRKTLLQNFPHIILTDEEFALDGMLLYGNRDYCAAADRDGGEIKEYINKKPSECKTPFAMWSKNEEKSPEEYLYFGLAMD